MRPLVLALAVLLVAPVAAAGAPDAHDHAVDEVDDHGHGLTEADLRIAAPASAMLPTPGFACEPAEMATGRLFPEPEMTNDFISFDEALCGLQKLAEDYPARVRIVPVTQSVGWESITGGRDTFDVFVVEVTNFDVGPAFADKPKIVFQLSIHGNEKGGREGGLRVIEDFAKGIGLADERPELASLLDLVGLVFVFPNPDGWTHEELEYRHNDACYFSAKPNCDAGETGLETQNFVRVNGNGVDINREWPTAGWVRERHTPMSEPEAVGLVAHKLTYANVRYASDIHGMLNPADLEPSDCIDPDPMSHLAPGACDPESRGHFVLTMLPAGRQSPDEMAKTTSLAERVKQTLNANEYYAEWNALPGFGAWGGEFNDWGTVWDTLGYTDSGFTSDWYAQDQGLNVPGVDFELAYNHVTFDNYYPGLAQRINMYHVEAVRDIVAAFMEQTAVDIGYKVDAKGTRTAYVVDPTVVTNEGNLGVDGWAAENDADDAVDTAHRVFRAAPEDYWLDLKDVLKNGDEVAVLDGLAPADLTADTLTGYDNLAVTGAAYDTFAADAAAIAAIKSFVEGGGNLLLTDGSIRLLADLGVVDAGAIDAYDAYAGYTNFVDTGHALYANVRGLARETYEPVPLGFTLEDGGASPIWFVDAAAWGGDVVGVAGNGQSASVDATRVTLGETALGEGRVVFLGALLPAPTTEFYAPYGVDSYSTTYTGNQLVRNVFGWEEVFSEEPLTPENAVPSTTTADSSETPRAPIPGAGALVALGALAAVGVVLRRRR